MTSRESDGKRSTSGSLRNTLMQVGHDVLRGREGPVLPGDGIGPEIVEASVQVLKAADKRFNLNIQLDYESVGFDSLKTHGTTLRDEVLAKAKTYDGIILGTQSHADYPVPEKGGRNVSAGFRIGLDLYANVRPARTRDFLESNMKAGKTMDLVIMREATEGFYPDRNMSRGWGEVMPSPDMALSTRKITRHCSERIGLAGSGSTRTCQQRTNQQSHQG